MTAPVAAIDCGTNSLRLLIAEPGRAGLREIDRRMIAVRLGEGVDRTGRFADAALQRTFAGCRQYRDLLSAHGVQRVRFVATSASRDAANAADFVHGVEEILAVTPEVISGDEEARLSFDGAMRGTAIARPALVFDIGGGSTEFIRGEAVPTAAVSVDMGCVRFTERFAQHDPMSAEELAQVRATVDRMLDDVERQVPLTGAAALVGLAGTVTTVTALALDLREYDEALIHHARIPAESVARVSETLLAMTAAQRAALPVMHPGRADVVAVGSAILAGIVRRSGADHLIASEHDILDGIAWSLTGEN